MYFFYALLVCAQQINLWTCGCEHSYHILCLNIIEWTWHRCFISQLKLTISLPHFSHSSSWMIFLWCFFSIEWNLEWFYTFHIQYSPPWINLRIKCPNKIIMFKYVTVFIIKRGSISKILVIVQSLYLIVAIQSPISSGFNFTLITLETC